MDSKSFLAATGILALAMSGSAIAQQAPSATDQILACQSIADAGEKLACFEAAAEAMAVEQAAPPAVTQTPAESTIAATPAPTPTQTIAATSAPVATATAEPERRRILPSWIPTVTIGRSDDKEPEPSTIEVSVTRIQRNKINRHFFTTSDGHVWEQITPETIRGPESLPAEATLRRMLSGSIRLGFPGTNRSYPVVRIE